MKRTVTVYRERLIEEVAEIELDVAEDVTDEAVRTAARLLVAQHPEHIEWSTFTDSVECDHYEVLPE